MIIIALGDSFAQINLPNYDVEQKNLIVQKWLETDQITDNQEKYDVHYYLFDYDYNVSFNTASPTAFTEVRLEVIDGPVTDIELNFGHTHTVDSIKVNMIPAVFQHAENILEIQLDRSYDNLENISLVIYYRGESRPLVADYNGKPLFWTIFEPYGARNTFPCKDTPKDKADSIDIKLTVPEGMMAVSNGLLVSKTIQGRNTTYWWKTKYPIATYLIFIAAYEYLHYRDWYVPVSGDSMPLDFYIVPDHFSNSQANFYETKNMISIFSELFGEYPFINEKYGHVEIVGGISMEHQTCSSLGLDMSSDGNYPLDLIAHELAHQWWGDMITCSSFHHIWLNEGFATYSEALYFESAGGEDSYNTVMAGNAYYGGGTIYVEDPENENIFDYGLTYRKAAYFLHMLRHVVGKSDFFEILRAYATDLRFRFETANTENFQEVCEEVSGKDLNKFFQQWIYGEYYPHYSYGWSIKPIEEGYNLKIRIDQIQERTGLFRMPIDIEVITNSYSITFTVQDSLQSQNIEFFIVEEPLSVQLDPNNWILKRTESGRVFPFPYAENVELDSRYQVPGVDVLGVRCELLNPENNNVEVTAVINSADKSEEYTIPMSDEGSHNDSTAGDRVYGGSWSVPEGENWYTVSIKTTSLNSGYYNVSSDQQSFTTIGPVGLSSYEIVERDTLVNPNDFLRVQYTAQNNGLTDTVFDISSKTRCLDPCAQIIAFSDPTYGHLAPGESSVASRPITIRFDEACTVPQNMMLAVDIFSENILLWSDTISLEIVSGITKDFTKLPEKFLLRQNYPNPFNPVTVINYELAITDNVELVIYNMLGEKVSTLVSKRQSAGTYKVEWDASNFSSGVYYYRLHAGQFVDVKKMILLR
jgi:hypothetical protein